MKKASATSGVALAAFVIIVWSATFVNTKALLADFSALEILAIRFALAWVALWAIHPHGMGPLRVRDEALFAAAGLGGAMVYQMLENVAIHFTNASNVGIRVATSSLFAAIMSRLLLGERTFTPRFLVGCVLALGGVVLVSLGGARVFHFRPIGDALALGAAMSWGVYSAAVTVVNRGGWHPVAAIRRAFFWALVFILPLLIFALAMPETAARISCSVDLSRLPNFANLAFLGLLASASCFVAWNKACDRLGTVRCSLGLYLIPVIAFLIAHIFLGETLPAAGVVGTGKIGRIFADICKGFGMRVLAYDAFPNPATGLEYVPFERLLAESDVVSLHCPLLPETKHMVNADSLTKAKRGFTLINTSRGGLVDSEALLSALRDGTVGAAGLDVYEEESGWFYEDRSDVTRQNKTLSLLVSLPNMIVTSHQAFLTREALANIASTTLANLDSYFSGAPLENEICYRCTGTERPEGISCPRRRNGRCF